MNTSNITCSRKKWKNMDLLIPYAAPYFAYVAFSSVLQNKLPEEIIYIMKLVIVPGLLIWAWKWYVPLTGPKNKWISCLWGIVFGIIGLVVWCGLYAPFTTPEDGAPWSDLGFALRLLTAGFVVPVFEELFMRGFVLRSPCNGIFYAGKKHQNPFLQRWMSPVFLMWHRASGPFTPLGFQLLFLLQAMSLANGPQPLPTDFSWPFCGY